LGGGQNEVVWILQQHPFNNINGLDSVIRCKKSQ